MRLIVCIDDNNGMLFNKRRQSRDEKVIENIISTIDKDKIFMNEYSGKLFDSLSDKINVVEAPFSEASSSDFVFAENLDLNLAKDIDEIIIYKWNRSYPFDVKFTIDLSEYKKTLEEEFVGKSHEKITKEVYHK